MRRKFILKEERFGRPIGTKVYEFTGHDYGLARDDTMYLNEEHICVKDEPDNLPPFFTAPTRILEEI